MSPEIAGAKGSVRSDAASGSAAHRTLSTGKKNFDALTGLRFFAAIGVVFYHFAGAMAAHGPRPLANLIDSGFVAVSFFYVLSGFVLSYSYVDRAGKVSGTRRTFWVARLARIYPAYLLAFLIAAPFNVLWTLRVNHLHVAVAKLVTGAVAVLTLQQAWTPWTAWYWNYPAWSVSVEAFFYLAFPFIAPQLKKFSAKACLPGMAFLWVVSLAAPVALWLGHGVTAGLGNHLQMAVEFTPLLRLPEFLLGLLLGRAYVLGFRFRPWVAQGLAVVSAVGVLVCLMWGSSIPRPVLASGLLAPLFALLVYTLAEGEGWLARALSWRFLVLLGEASYGIYILQIPVSYVLRIPPPHHSVATFALYLVVLIGAALVSWQFVERPLRVRIRNRLLKTRGAQPPPPPARVSARSPMNLAWHETPWASRH